MQDNHSAKFITALRAPAIALVILLIPAAIYLLHVRSQSESLKNRNFRILATLSDQIQAKMNAYRTVIGHAAGESHGKFTFGPFLKAQGLACVKAGCESERPPSPPATLKVLHSVDQSVIELVYTGAGEVAVRRKLDLARVVVEPLLTEIPDIFDDVVVADQSDRSVIHQLSREALRFSNVDSFLPHEATPSTGKTPDEAAEPKAAPVRFTTTLIETKISGTDFKVFLQPIKLSLEGKDGKPAEWLLCGLVRSDRFLSETMMISYGLLVVLGCLLLVVILCWPLFKLMFMSGRERLRPVDGVATAFSLMSASSIAVLLVLHVYHSTGLEYQSDRQLLKLNAWIQRHLHSELVLMIGQLRTLSQDLTDLTSEDKRAQTRYLDGLSEDKWKGIHYPYFDLAHWANQEGRQTVKWFTRGVFTPFIDLNDRPIYRGFVNDHERWRLGGMGSDFLLYATNSPTTGENQAVLAIENPNNAAIGGALPWAFMTSRPLSLFAPVLPPGFGFSVISKKGSVFFHSNSARNERENFFDECDKDRSVRSAAYGDSGAFATADYVGREHRLYIAPMPRFERNQWSLVAFRDRALTSTVSLEIVTTAIGLFVMHLLLLALAVAVIGAVWGLRHPLSWLWPSETRADDYRRLLVVNTMASLFFVACLRHSNPEILVLGAILLSALAAGAVYVRLGGVKIPIGRARTAAKSATASMLGAVVAVPFLIAPEFWMDVVILTLCVAMGRWLLSSRAVKQTFERVVGWRHGYSWVVFTLAIMLGILPCIAYWKTAYHYHTSLYLRYGQQRMASALEARNRVEQKTSDLTARHKAEYLRQYSIREKQTELLGAYHPVFYDSEVHTQKAPGERADAGLLDGLLHALTVPYNQAAVELRGIAADSGGWARRDSGSRQELHVPDRKISFALTSVTPGLWRPSDVGGWSVIVACAAALLCILWCSIGLARYLQRKLFLEDVPEPEAPIDAGALPKGPIAGCFLFAGVSGRDKAEWLRRENPLVIDLAELSAADGGGPETPSRRTIAVDHFEHRIGDPAYNQRKLELLERLVFGQKANTVVFSAVDPFYFFWAEPSLAGADSTVLDRWATVFKGFSLRVSGPPTEPELLEETDWFATWAGCSTDERLVIGQLARGGLVNPRSDDALAQLLRKGLVVRDPACRLANPALARFALRAQTLAEIRQWETGPEGWNEMSRTLMLVLIGVVMLLFVAQRQILSSWIPYVTGVAGTIGAVLKMVSASRGGKEIEIDT